jgi:hypothetical protein
LPLWQQQSLNPLMDLSALVGEWKGDSICQASGSACHNEKVIWHVAKQADKPGWVTVRGERIEGGKAVAMGTLEFKWDRLSPSGPAEAGSGRVVTVPRAPAFASLQPNASLGIPRIAGNFWSPFACEPMGFGERRA